MYKKIISLVLVLLCLFTPVTASAIEMQVDNRPLVTDAEPILIEGKAFVPMRAVLEALGAEIVWDAVEKKVIAQKDAYVIALWLNQKIAYVNGVIHDLPTPPILHNGRIFLPARFVSEKLGCQVYWDKEADSVFVFTKDTYAKAYLEKKERQKKEQAERAAASVPKQTTKVAVQKQAPQSRQIYITRTGKRYHYDNHCNGGTYFPATLQEALDRGLTPCKKCVG